MPVGFNGRKLLGFGLLFWHAAGANGGQGPQLQADMGDAQTDRDRNGIADELELRLANRFAPVLFYDAGEPNLPTSVEQFLKNTNLWFFSEYCRPQQVQAARSGTPIPHIALSSCRSPGETIDSRDTRSTGKKSTFYLRTVAEAQRRGSLDTELWVTYFHAYRNDMGGITLQFWRFYAYNTGYWLGFHIENGDHGGDWEAIHVVLGPSLTPIQIRLLGHRNIATRPWSDVLTEGGHPLIVCAKGSHTSELMSKGDLAARHHMIEQESWNGGTVHWLGHPDSKSGPLVSMGQKTCPLPGMDWLRYSGLWGNRASSGLFSFYNSGYWGPAFNETGLRADGFISAWCEGMATPQTGSAKRDGFLLKSECYAVQAVP